MQEIKIKVIQFKADWGENPLPYVPSLCEWNDHVVACVQCARVDQLAQAGRAVQMTDLCEGGSILQFTLHRRIEQQWKTSLLN